MRFVLLIFLAVFGANEVSDAIAQERFEFVAHRPYEPRFDTFNHPEAVSGYVGSGILKAGDQPGEYQTLREPREKGLLNRMRRHFRTRERVVVTPEGEIAPQEFENYHRARHEALQYGSHHEVNLRDGNGRTSRTYYNLRGNRFELLNPRGVFEPDPRRLNPDEMPNLKAALADYYGRGKADSSRIYGQRPVGKTGDQYQPIGELGNQPSREQLRLGVHHDPNGSEQAALNAIEQGAARHNAGMTHDNTGAVMSFENGRGQRMPEFGQDPDLSFSTSDNYAQLELQGGDNWNYGDIANQRPAAVPLGQADIAEFSAELQGRDDNYTDFGAIKDRMRQRPLPEPK